MRIDMHTHSLPVSGCAHHEPELVPEFLKAAGIDAIVLTNHYCNWHCKKLGDTLEEQAKVYVDTFKRCKEKGESIGVKVFFGAEIKLDKEVNAPEFLLYGLSEEAFLESYPLYNVSQKELFDFCEKNNILMVQSHPYRSEQGYSPADMNYAHGVEVYNPHLCFPARYEEALKLATDNDKIKTSGSDFHVKDQAGLAGMIVPDDICDQFMLRDFLRERKAVIFDENGILYEE